MPKDKDIFQVITDRIIAELEKGTAPWIKPWTGGKVHDITWPRNHVTKHEYRGINVLMLWLEAAAKGYEAGEWLTFKQAKSLGGTVRKGEKGTSVLLWKPFEKLNPETGRKDKLVYAREFFVFNIAQCDGLPERRATAVTAPTLEERNAAFMAMVKETGAKVETGGNQAFYSPALDFIRMPALGRFRNAAHYDATLAHELTHWTGHKTRCDRKLSDNFHQEGYAFEELVAELGAAFVCGHFGITGDLRHASYIASWLKALKDDKRFVIRAATKAQNAFDFMTGKVKAEPVEERIAA